VAHADELKEMASRYPTGVVVITARGPHGPAGFTAQTFVSLSLEPPLVSFAVASEGKSWATMRDATHFGVNVLRADQAELAVQFATSGIDKYDGVSWRPGPDGSPLLEGALAWLEGERVAESRYGDHDVVVLSAAHVEYGEGEPLIYHRRGFRSLES
jgi:flavin reductase (DIM6/NTAB) family NADH-FMN oxidoreductase RutF